MFVSVDKLQQRGFNAEASYKLYKDLSLYTSYAYTKSTIMDNTATIGDGTYATAGKSFVDVPKHTLYLGGSFTHGPFWANLNGSYRSSSPRSATTSRNPPTRWTWAGATTAATCRPVPTCMAPT